MKSFKRIVCLDKTNLSDWALNKLADFSIEPVEYYSDYPKTEKEKLQRITDSDCVLLSWNTNLSSEIINKTKGLKYIGMCCSLYDKSSANVDIDAAEKNGIKVEGVKDYGDEGVVEFIFSELIQLAKGLGSRQWKDSPTELKGKVLGIIGFGTLGKMVASVAVAFGLKVLYYSRTRKKNLETSNIRFSNLENLLKEADIVTTHLPRNNQILGRKEFEAMKPNSILVNTSLGPTYNIDVLKEWIDKNENYLIVDLDGAEGYIDVYKNHPKIIFFEGVVGMTDAAYDRLSQKVIQNIEEYLNSQIF